MGRASSVRYKNTFIAAAAGIGDVDAVDLLQHSHEDI